LLFQDTGGLFLGLPELPPVFGLVLVLLLVLLNGFFVATEFALVAVRRSRIDQLVAEGHATARAVKRATERLNVYVAGTQLGITIASLALGWVGEPALSGLLDPLFSAIVPAQWVAVSSHAVSAVIAFLVITILHMVLGEFAPKGLALQRAEATALWVTLPMTVFIRIFRPAIAVIDWLGNRVLRLMGLDSTGWEESVHSVEELRYLVEKSRSAGVLESAEEEIAGRALTLGDLTAHSVMVPRNEMVMVPLDITAEELLRLAGRERHVRFPVYKDSPDNIVGIVYLTDVLAWRRTHRPEGTREPFSVQAVMRPPLRVPESIKGDQLLAQMRQARTHTAIVVDEFGGVAGMATLQDLLERIVGEMPEQDDQGEADIVVQPDGSVRVNGLTSLEELRGRFALDLEDGVEAETVGGYVMEMLGHVPQVGEVLDLDPYSLRVTEMDGPRVAEVTLVR
jgi:putative hemolysin